MLKSFFFIIAILSWFPFNSAIASGASLPSQPHIIVSGYGFVEQIPDEISINFNVSATASSFAQAKQEVDIIVDKALNAARKNGIKKRHINASNINASPQYQWTNQKRKYTGEQVSRQVELTLTDTKLYNKLVNDLLATGITRLQPAQLNFSQIEKLKSKALLLALDNAKEKATTMANHLGSNLGHVYQISETGNQRPVMRMAMAARSEMADQNKGAPLSLGEEKVEKSLQVVFLLNNP